MQLINIAAVSKVAYEMGYQRFEGAQDDYPDEEPFELSLFTDSAEYANGHLPALRGLAGYTDAGYGTYRQDEKVAVITQDDAEEIAAEAGHMDVETCMAGELLDEIWDAWADGAHDGAARLKKNERYMDLRVE